MSRQVAYIKGLYSGDSVSKRVLGEKTDVDMEDKGESIFRSEFYSTPKRFKHGKVVGKDEIPSEILQSTGEICEERLFQLIC